MTSELAATPTQNKGREGLVYAWYVLIMMMALYAFNYADRYVAAGLVLGVLFAGWFADVLADSYGDQSLRISVAISMPACLPGGYLFWRGSRLVSRETT